MRFGTEILPKIFNFDLSVWVPLYHKVGVCKNLTFQVVAKSILARSFVKAKRSGASAVPVYYFVIHGRRKNKTNHTRPDRLNLKKKNKKSLAKMILQIQLFKRIFYTCKKYFWPLSSDIRQRFFLSTLRFFLLMRMFLVELYYLLI